MERWPLARTALRGAGERFAGLVAANRDPGLMATREWTVAESAAHVLSIAWLYVALVEDGAHTLDIPDLDAALRVTNVDTVAEVNAMVLEHFTERDPGELAAQLREAVRRILDATEHADPAATVTWLGDAQVPIAGLLSHLVNELLVHGWDMARAMRRPWPMPEAHAALYWEQFFIGMLGHTYGALLNTDVPMPRHRIAVEFRSAYTVTATVVLQDAKVFVAPPGDPYDVRVWFRPSRFNLMLFGRVGAIRSALRGDVVVSGPRPWRLPAFLRVVHMPNKPLRS